MLVLIRHGQSQGNAEGRLLGHLDSPLTPTGVGQAEALAAVLAPLVAGASRILSSPLGRARATAAAVARRAPVEVDQRWVEVDYGEYDGALLGEVPRQVWSQWRADAGFTPPGGESLATLGRRVRPACEELFDGGAGPAVEGDVVVVSHVSPIKAAVAWALDAPDTVAWRLRLSTASVTTIAWGAAGPLLQRFNWTVPQG